MPKTVIGTGLVGSGQCVFHCDSMPQGFYLEQAAIRLVTEMHQPDHPLYKVFYTEKGVLRNQEQLSSVDARTNTLTNSTIANAIRLFNNKMSLCKLFF